VNFIKKHSVWLVPALLVLASAIAYLPNVNHIGYLKDDWYLMYAGHTQGAGIFKLVFASDRPLRAYVLGPAYALFGDNPLYYHLSGYLFRLLSGLAAYWMLALLWPRRRASNLAISLLFLLYPGFLSQVNPIDYQSQLLSLFLAMLSLALTFKAVLLPRKDLPGKILLLAASILTGWGYLGLVEYFIGLEVLRVLGVYLLVRHEQPRPLFEQVRLTLWKWLPGILVPGGFLFWRTFFFENERKATDLGAQLSGLAESPLVTGLWKSLYVLFDTLKVTLFAWAVPFYNLGFQMRLRENLLGLGLAALVAALAAWSAHQLGQGPDEREQAGDWRVEALVVGLLTVIGGMTPIILVNRQADFGEFSRYSLGAAIGGVMLLVGLVYYLSRAWVRHIVIGVLLVLAVLTQQGNAYRAATETASIRDFWWQVSWRAPQLEPGATLIADYAQSAIPEDYVVWGAANLIYYPESQDDKMRPPLAAIVLTDGNLLNVLSRQGQYYNPGRGIVTYPSYDNVLVMSQPTADSCVHIMDGQQPELSSRDQQRILMAAPYSRIGLVETDLQPHTPPTVSFGPEPGHGWCYYYQKASLARQTGDWQTVADLGDKARSKKLEAADPVEWLPFLQAYAMLDQTDQLQRLARFVKKDPFQAQQACRVLTGSTPANYQLSPETRGFVETTFCVSDE
jgi:hypothetical protein